MLLVSVNLVNIHSVFAEKIYSSNREGYREIRVFQGYPRSNHQGYNWSSVTPTTHSVKDAHKVVNNEKSEKKSQVSPKILLKRSGSSNEVNETTVSPLDAFNANWKPIIDLNKTFSKTSMPKSKFSSSKIPKNKKPDIDPLGLSGLSNFTDLSSGDDDKSRKLEVVVPFHPRFTSLARLLARSCKF